VRIPRRGIDAAIYCRLQRRGGLDLDSLVRLAVDVTVACSRLAVAMLTSSDLMYIVYVVAATSWAGAATLEVIDGVSRHLQFGSGGLAFRAVSL
jgi:hypothetical protein